MPKKPKKFDAFVSHASEDKDSVAQPLADRLHKTYKLRIWYDEFSLKVGDSLRRSIDHGLANSTFGVIIISPSFFSKHWPQKELNALMGELHADKLLPVWHEIRKRDVEQFSPMLADIKALKTEDGIDHIALELAAAITKNPLLRKYNYSSRKERRKMAAALYELGEAAIKPLVRLSRDDDWIVREIATDSLGRIERAQVIEPLISLLDDESYDVQKAAVNALLNLRGISLQPLVKTLSSNKNAFIRSQAAYLLGELRDPAALTALKNALEDENLRVQLAAFTALRKLNDIEINSLIEEWQKNQDSFKFDEHFEVPITHDRPEENLQNDSEPFKKISADELTLRNLIECLTDHFPPIRSFAAQFLGIMRDKKAVKPLIDVLQDEHSTVRDYAAKALGKIGDLSALDSLINALTDENPLVRRNAAAALGELRDRRAVDSLKRSLSDADSAVRAQSVVALRDIGGKIVVDTLIDMLNDESAEVRQQAVIALGYIADDKAITPLMQAYKSDKAIAWEAGGMLRIILKRHGIDF